jgi:hypothetical protein
MRAAALLIATLPFLLPGIALAQGANGTTSPPSAAAPLSTAPTQDQAAPAPMPTARNGGGMSCADVPKAQSFVDKLRPGPNTREAQHHLDLAKSATSDQNCVAELHQVDTYARRSSEADKRMASAERHPRHHAIQCADPMHQGRPGGTDYKGPPVRGCHTPRV